MPLPSDVGLCLPRLVQLAPRHRGPRPRHRGQERGPVGHPHAPQEVQRGRVRLPRGGRLRPALRAQPLPARHRGQEGDGEEVVLNYAIINFLGEELYVIG